MQHVDQIYGYSTIILAAAPLASQLAISDIRWVWKKNWMPISENKVAKHLEQCLGVIGKIKKFIFFFIFGISKICNFFKLWLFGRKIP